jgi:hypothetical protein
MTIWKYVGCSLSDMPDDYRNSEVLSTKAIKNLLDNVPLIEGQIEARTVDALTALLIEDNIVPIKIHPLDRSENSIERLKRIQSMLRKRIN